MYKKVNGDEMDELFIESYRVKRIEDVEFDSSDLEFDTLSDINGFIFFDDSKKTKENIITAEVRDVGRRTGRQRTKNGARELF